MHQWKIKLQASIPDEHGCKVFKKIFANQIKKTINHDRVGFVPGMQA